MADYKLKLKALFHEPIDKLLVIKPSSQINIDKAHNCPKFHQHQFHEKVAEHLFRYLFDECPHEDEVKTASHLSFPLSRIIVNPQNLANESQFEEESAVDLNETNFIDIFSEKVEDIQTPKNHDEVEKFFKKLNELSFPNQGEKAKFLFLFLWRFFPEIFPWIEKHPVDSRVPNHSIYDYLVQTSAIVSALPKPAFLLFTISPVQEFISRARKTSDLWAGSYILSYLIYKAIEVVIEELGPDNVIYPNLFGQPLIDRYIANLKLSDGKTLKDFFSEHFGAEEWFKKFIDNAYSDEKLTIANFPNRFLAIVPYDKNLVKRIEKAVKCALFEFANKVEEKLKSTLEKSHIAIPQIKRHLLSHFQIYWVLMPWSNDTQNYSPDNALGDYEKLISNKTETYNLLKILKEHVYYKHVNVGSAYSLLLELTEKLLGARKGIRTHIRRDFYESLGVKCHLCGEFEVLDIDWDKLEENYKVKSKEKLCGVCLTKRLFPEIIKDVLELDEEIKFPSTSEMASIGEKRRLTDKIKNQFKDKFDDFKQRIKQENNKDLPKTISVPKLKENPLYQIDGQWLMEETYRKEYFKSEYSLEISPDDYKEILSLIHQNGINPSRYYAIFMVDGDNIGKWLKGEFNPKIGDTIHQKAKDALIKFSQNGKEKDLLERLLCLRHPVSSSIHQAFSKRLSRFALEKVRKIVEDEHYGKLVYAGGDDVLAFLPIEEVLDCAYKIQRSFKEVLSPKASMSAGILIVHHKYPLYLALEEVRSAERLAKDKYGKDAFCISLKTHSGEQRNFGSKWDEIPFLKELIRKFRADELPSKLAYDFAEAVNEVGDLDKEILSLELKRIYSRKSDDTAFLEKILNKFEFLAEKYDVYNFINLLLISRFLANEYRI